MKGLTFRRADSGDIPEINKLVNSAYRGQSSRSGWTTEADFLEGIRTDEQQLAALMSAPQSIFLICFDEANHLLGSVYLEKQNHKLYLGMLTVNPALQNRGAGKQLMQQAERYALEQGCDTITMTVITKRHELIAWYERRGYQQTGERKPFPNDPKFGLPKEPLEFVVMEKHL
jgi:ribosomal protein S18 acetylase RimI-like enzyme